MFWNILSVENTKILKRRIIWVEMGILAALIIGLYTIIYITIRSTNEQAMPNQARQQVMNVIKWPGALESSLSMGSGNSLGGLLLIVLVGAATAQEYTWRTMHLWLSQGLPRSLLLLAKFTAILVPILLIVVTPLIIGGGITAIFTLLMDKSLPLGQIQFWNLMMSVLRTAYTLLPYAALTFMLAIVTRSTAAAIGIGLAYGLLIESVASTVFTLLGGFLRDIVAYLPGSLAEGLLKLNQTSAAPVPSAIGLAVWTIVFIGLAILSFQRQDMAE
jgi:ABC-type transport system involved in multi-copper enzyme maturation permease subunit